MTEQKVRRRSRIQKQFRLHALLIYPFCQWCQRPLHWDDATTDHIVPLSRGGSNDWVNLCLACRDCNGKRKDDPPLAPPSGPVWAKEQQTLVAWTRYPGGRWRTTLRGYFPQELRLRALMLVGQTAEVVILHKDEEMPDAFIVAG